MTDFSRRDATRLLGLGAALLASGGVEAAGTNKRFELDHIVWAVPDLDEGVALITELTGVAPVSGGIAPGRTAPHNALLALGGGSYLEVFSPTRATGNGGKWGELITDGKPHVASYALRVEDHFAALLGAFPVKGVAHSDPRPMGRVRPDGGKLNWELVHLIDTPLAPVLPFFIDWLGSKPHPSESSPRGITIDRIEVAHPQADELVRIHRALGIETPVLRGDKPAIHLLLNAPKGKVWLST